jgi:hypothetical protein
LRAGKSNVAAASSVGVSVINRFKSEGFLLMGIEGAAAASKPATASVTPTYTAEDIKR